MQLFHWLLGTPLIDDWSSTRYTLGDFDNPSNALKNSPKEEAFVSLSPLAMSEVSTATISLQIGMLPFRF